MDMAMETIAFSVTAPGASFTAMTGVGGDSARIRQSSRSRLLDVLGLRQAAGAVRITSPLLHDNTVGLTYMQGVQKQWTQTRNPQELVTQDTLSIAATGSAVAGDVELNALTIMYQGIPGIAGQLIGQEALRNAVDDTLVMRSTITPTGQGWSGTVAITALDDVLKANRKYAWIGVVDNAVNASCLCVSMLSPDWGNLRIGVPLLNVQVNQTSNYLEQLSIRQTVPSIPVLSSNNKSNIFLSGLFNENFAPVTVSLVLMLLKDTVGGVSKGKRCR